MSFAHYTHKGLRRNNQDYVRVSPERKIAIIGDGMSQQEKGEAASRAGVETAYAYLHLEIQKFGEGTQNENIDDRVKLLLQNTGALANQAVLNLNKNLGINSGSTLEALTIIGDTAFLLHIGDSIVYHYNGWLRQITKDHYIVKWARRKQKDGSIKITFVGGMYCFLGDSVPRGEIISWQLEKNDIILMCTDGLSEEISKKKISEMIKTGKTPCNIKQLLIDECDGKTDDNNTFVIYRHDGKNERTGHTPKPDIISPQLKKTQNT